MINFTEIQRNENSFTKNKEVLLPLRAVWVREGEKQVNEDGSFRPGADIETIINVAIEALEDREPTNRRPQGIDESSTHSIMTLKAWGIKVNDIIIYDGNNYRIIYKFTDQYQTDFQEYQAKIFTHTQ